MIITSASADDRIRLIAIEMKGAFGNEGALPLFSCLCALDIDYATGVVVANADR
jgi:hypothetical protein